MPTDFDQTPIGSMPTAVWHALRVEFSGTRIRVLLDGKAYIELDDRNISGPGAVGVWTKADSVTAFDDFCRGKTTKDGPNSIREE